MTDTSREVVEALVDHLTSLTNWSGSTTFKAAATLRALLDEQDRLREALEWYRGNVSWCNNFGREGTEARDRLAKDGGARAEAALKETTYG